MAEVVGFWLKGGVPEPQDMHITLYTLLFLAASSYVILYQMPALKCQTVCKEKAPCKASKSGPLLPIN